MPDLRQLRAFVAVAETRNFTRAAERLHVAQQAVSKTVRQLERELGVDLLERTTREVRLTPAGAALLADGREALAAAEYAFARATEVGRGLIGRVHVGISPAVGLAERRLAIEALRDGAPGLGVALLEVRPADVAPKLRAGELDLVLGRAEPRDAGVDWAPLRPTPAVLCVPAGHRLAERDAPIDLAAADGERVLVWNRPGTAYTDLIVGRFAERGARVQPVESRVTGGSGLEDLVAHGAIALVPEGGVSGDDVVVLETAGVTLPLLVVWAAGRPPAAVARLRARLD